MLRKKLGRKSDTLIDPFFEVGWVFENTFEDDGEVGWAIFQETGLGDP